MKRRAFLIAGTLGAIVVDRLAAQTRPARVGILNPVSREKSVAVPIFLQRLAEVVAPARGPGDRIVAAKACTARV